MPFRSESEQIREQIRRAEEVAGELLDEKNDLERQIGAQRRGYLWVVTFIAGAVATTILGYAAGALAASVRIPREVAARERGQGEAAEREEARHFDCKRAALRVAEDLLTCQHDLTERSRPRFEAPVPSEHCPCHPNDPLCSCPFDRGAAATELGNVVPRLNRCVVEPRGSLHTKVIFAPETGAITSAVVDQSGPDLTAAEKACIERELLRVKIPSFTGAPVTVGKTFNPQALKGPGTEGPR